MRLVIFDLDGTLIDSVRYFVDTVSLAFAAVEQHVPDEVTIRSISGITARDAMAALAPGSSPDRVDEILESYRTHYRARAGVDREPLFPGALDALDRLAVDPETTIAVATGKGYAGAIKLLEVHGILGRFHSIQTPDHNRGKPDPHMIETAMEHALADRHSTVMVGDTVHDMRMAKSAGVKAIGVSWGYHTIGELRTAGADIIIDDFDGLDAAIEQVLGPRDA